MARLVSYDWPGNVRELIHVIQRAAALAGAEIIDIGNLPDPLATLRPIPVAEGEEDGLPMREAVAALEARMIRRALLRAEGNRSQAARQLGIARPQLYAKMQEHGIDADDPGE
jgi:DNA-binding NtrC family response regulator